MIQLALGFTSKEVTCPACCGSGIVTAPMVAHDTHPGDSDDTPAQACIGLHYPWTFMECPVCYGMKRVMEIHHAKEDQENYEEVGTSEADKEVTGRGSDRHASTAARKLS